MSQSDSTIYDDTPEAGCFTFASAMLLIVALLLLLMSSRTGVSQHG